MVKKKKIEKTDTVLKEFWRDNERFADLFNTILFEGSSVISPEELEEQDTDVSKVLSLSQSVRSLERTRDIVRKSNGVAEFVLLGIENQMKIHYAMPLRTMIYDGLTYLKEYDEVVKYNGSQKGQGLSSAEFLSGFRKADRLHPVITLVIYYGEEEWDGPFALKDMLQVPEGLNRFVSDYQMNLLNIHDSDKYQFKNTDIEVVFDVIRKLYKNQYQELKAAYDDKTIPYELFQVITAVTNAKEWLGKAVYEENGEVSMCRALEEWISQGRDEGRIAGKNEGRIEGIRELIANMLQNGMSAEEIVRYAGVSPAVVAEMQKNICV